MRAAARRWIDFMRLVGGWLVLSACMGVMLLMGCRPANAETALERIEKARRVRIGYANEAPFAYTLPDGRVTGSRRKSSGW